MSIIQVRDAFVAAAGDRLTLHSILMNYAEDRKAQILSATGTFPDGAHFNAKTEPFVGDTTVIMARAAQLAEEIIAPANRAQGVAVTHAGEDSDLVQTPATPPTPKPKSAKTRKAKR